MTANAPMTPVTGSTIAELCPYRKLFQRDIPSLLSGIDTSLENLEYELLRGNFMSGKILHDSKQNK
jgi:hypothetical protein